MPDLTHELGNAYDDSYMDDGKVYVNKEKRLNPVHILKRSDTPGPLLDLLKDLVDVSAARYEDPPFSEEEEKALFRTINPSLVRYDNRS